MSALCFEPLAGHARNDVQQDHWSCMFEVHQRWLIDGGKRPSDASAADREKSQEKIVNFILSLIEQSQQDVGKIHGLLLPELGCGLN